MSKFSRYYKIMTFVIVIFLCVTLIPSFLYNLQKRNIESLILIGLVALVFSVIYTIIHCCFNHYCDALNIIDNQVHFFLLNGKEFVASINDVKHIACRWDRHVFYLPTKKIVFLRRPFLSGKPIELTNLHYFYNATISKE